MCLAEIFILACFVGYLAIWQVSPMLHSPLMSVTNAISGVVILGAMEVIDTAFGWRLFLVEVAVCLAAINIFGGFYVSARMLKMFKPKDSDHD
jgi:NAD(P) transhydrogenase subunit alpha